MQEKNLSARLKTTNYYEWLHFNNLGNTIKKKCHINSKEFILHIFSVSYALETNIQEVLI